MATEVTGNPRSVAYYEGLIFVTTKRIEKYVEAEPEDIAQRLRIKVWTALERYDQSRSKMTVERWIFQCLRNEVKDILKKRKEFNVHIEEFSAPQSTGSPNADSRSNLDATPFARRYLSVAPETVFADVEDDEDEVILPGLTEEEQTVARLLVENYTQPEIAVKMGIRLLQVRAYIAAIKLKLTAANPDLSRFIEADEMAVAA